jgi:hypothetical protein
MSERKVVDLDGFNMPWFRSMSRFMKKIVIELRRVYAAPAGTTMKLAEQLSLQNDAKTHRNPLSSFRDEICLYFA